MSFMDAFNKKDGAEVLELTSPRDVIAHMANAPEAARRSMADSAAQNIQRIADAVGQLQSCSVDECRESTFQQGAQPPGPMGAGRYVDIKADVKGSKRDAKVTLKLYRKADSSDPIVGLWNFTWSPF